jgi:4-amino-4-deoxy-L-arabinose transferase-like glycosyltransferase
MAVVALVAFGVRLAYAMLWSRHVSLGFDGRTYYELAKRLAHDHAYLSVFPPRRGPTAIFPPGFPVLLGAMRIAGLATRTRLLIGMALVGTATVVVIGLLARRIGGDRAALVAAGIAAVYPNLFLAEGALMSEALIALLVAVALLALVMVMEQPSGRRMALAGLPLGYAAVTRSDGWMLAVVLVVATVMGVRAIGRRARLGLVAAGLAATIVIAGSWETRNEVQFHTFVPIAVNSWSVIGGANCEKAYYGPRLGTWYVECLTQLARRAGSHREVPLNRQVASDGMDYARGHLSRLPVVLGARLGLTFGVYQPWRELEVEGFFEGRSVPWSKVGWVMYVGLAALAFVGARRLWRGRRPVAVLLLAPLVIVVLSTLVGYGNQRFRMPFEPSLVVLAAIGLTSLLNRRTRGTAPREQLA